MANSYSGTPYSGYKAAELPSATSQAQSISDYYDRYIQSAKDAAASEYDQDIQALDYERSKISPEYKAQREAAAASQAIADKNFAQKATANGINTGAGSQYALASQNAAQTNQTSLRKSEAEAQADIEQQRAQYMAKYQAAVTDAINSGELNRAKALYEEAQRVDDSLVATAQNQATENYRSWQSAFDAQTAYDQAQYQQDLNKAQTLASYGDFWGYQNYLGYTPAERAAMENYYRTVNGY